MNKEPHGFAVVNGEAMNLPPLIINEDQTIFEAVNARYEAIFEVLTRSLTQDTGYLKKQFDHATDVPEQSCPNDFRPSVSKT